MTTATRTAPISTAIRRPVVGMLREGTSPMRVAIVSDIHGNRHAFEAVLEAVDAAGIEEMWCLGDLVGYGAEPDACVALAERHCAVCLCGNHDLGVVGSLSLEDFSRGARIAAEWTRDTISEASRDFLLALHPSAEARGYGLFHASPRDPVWEYVLSPEAADACLDEAQERVSLIGHSHQALAFHRAGGEPVQGYRRRADTRAELSGGEWLLNPGSVGQPRDGDPRAAWLELDAQAWSAHWRRTVYDVEGAAAAILAAGLPDGLAARLHTGR